MMDESQCSVCMHVALRFIAYFVIYISDNYKVTRSILRQRILKYQRWFKKRYPNPDYGSSI
jgi:hypothetical protein